MSLGPGCPGPVAHSREVVVHSGNRGGLSAPLCPVAPLVEMRVVAFRIKRHSGSGVRPLPDVLVPGIPRARALPRCGQIYGARNMATRWLSGLVRSSSFSGWRPIQVHSLSVLSILMSELHARATNLRVSWSLLTNLRVFVPRLCNCLETRCSWSLLVRPRLRDAVHVQCTVRRVLCVGSFYG